MNIILKYFPNITEHQKEQFAMLDELVHICREKGISRIIGRYIKSPKNHMVAELYGSFGFTLISASENGDSVWELNVSQHKNKNHVIKVN